MKEDKDKNKDIKELAEDLVGKARDARSKGNKKLSNNRSEVETKKE